jgi:hypothetical protein
MSNPSHKALNRALWTAQTLASLLFLFAGAMKFIMPAEKMQQGPIVFSIAFMHFIGICEILGALGLVLPGVSRIQTWLTPLAAAGLTIIMMGATAVTISAMGAAAATLPVIVGVVTIWIAMLARALHQLQPLRAACFAPPKPIRGIRQCVI